MYNGRFCAVAGCIERINITLERMYYMRFQARQLDSYSSRSTRRQLDSSTDLDARPGPQAHAVRLDGLDSYSTAT